MLRQGIDLGGEHWNHPGRRIDLREQQCSTFVRGIARRVVVNLRPQISHLLRMALPYHTKRYGMAVATKNRWLDAGLHLLSQEGIAALRIDRLAAALTLSKGSFYHHFAGISGYRLDLLDYYEDRCTTSHIRAVDAAGNLSPSDKLDRLRQVVIADDEWG